VDLHDPTGEHPVAGLFGPPKGKDKEDVRPPTKPAWHGTILPASDADLWLATAFAEYEQMVSLERGYAQAQSTKCLCMADYDKVAESLFGARARYFAGTREAQELPLSSLKWDPASDAWYKVASGKGVLILAELRRLMGDNAFTTMMDEFGRTHAGGQVTSAQFTAQAAKAAGHDLAPFFKYWLNQTGLPRLELVSASASSNSVHGVLAAQGGPLPSNMEITVEYAGDEELTQILELDAEGRFEIKTTKPARTLVIDKYARVARANGSEADVESFTDDLDHTLIVYGTADDTAANHEAAEACQKAIRSARYNIELPVKTDAGLTDEQLKSHHLILIGRPEANTVTARVAQALPVTFGPASFTVRERTYANMASAVLAAGVNPLNPHFSVVALAGNSAAATLAHAEELGGRGGRTEVKVFDAAGKPKSLVVPAPELVHTFSSGRLAARGP
jgi:aminopeptidase N